MRQSFSTKINTDRNSWACVARSKWWEPLTTSIISIPSYLKAPPDRNTQINPVNLFQELRYGDQRYLNSLYPDATKNWSNIIIGIGKSRISLIFWIQQKYYGSLSYMTTTHNLAFQCILNQLKVMNSWVSSIWKPEW